MLVAVHLCGLKIINKGEGDGGVVADMSCIYVNMSKLWIHRDEILEYIL